MEVAEAGNGSGMCNLSASVMRHQATSDTGISCKIMPPSSKLVHEPQ